MTIEIWNPKEMPFGSLSNSATYVMKIDDVNYTTVTNYIYSNLLSNKEYFQTLKNINTKDVYEYLNMYDKEYINSIISKSLKEATVQKFKNKELEEILLTTENYPIVFMSDDNILGSGKESLGQNLVGKVLMQIRDSVIAKEGEKEKKLYEAYTALQILEKSMFEEVSDLREFAGLNQKEIISILSKKNDATITFNEVREDERTINRISKHLEAQNKLKINQFKAVIEYVQEKNICKQKIIMSYFGEIIEEDCGKCSNCINKKNSVQIDTTIFQKIKELLAKQDFTSRDIQKLTKFSQEEVIFALQELLEQQEIEIKSNNHYSLKQ